MHSVHQNTVTRGCELVALFSRQNATWFFVFSCSQIVIPLPFGCIQTFLGLSAFFVRPRCWRYVFRCPKWPSQPSKRGIFFPNNCWLIAFPQGQVFGRVYVRRWHLLPELPSARPFLINTLSVPSPSPPHSVGGGIMRCAAPPAFPRIFRMSPA